MVISKKNPDKTEIYARNSQNRHQLYTADHMIY